MPGRQDTFDGVVAAVATDLAGNAVTEIDIVGGGAAGDALVRWGDLHWSRRRPGNAFHFSGLLRSALSSATDRAAIVLVKRGSDIATIWPLRFEHRYGMRIATDLAAPFAQYSDVIGEPLDRHTLQVLRTRLRDEFGVDALLCRGVRQDSGLAKALADTNAVEESAAPFIDIHGYGTFAAYCTRFSKQTARNRRQRRRRLEARHGPLRFAVLDGRRGRDALVQAMQWKRDWLEAHGLSSGVVSVRERQEALLAAIDDPAAHISVLSVRDTPVAVELGFSCAGHYTAFMGAFDPEFATYSPGQEQMLLTIEWCFAQGFSRYDLLPPRDPYKLHWTRPHDEEPVADHCIALSSAGALYALVRRHARAPLKRTILRLPAALRVAARRYGPAAAGIGAAAATIGILAE